MSVSDLKKLGLLRPESEWSGKGVGRSAYPLRTALFGVLGLAGCGAMVVGDGGMWTWIGLAVFMLMLALFVFVNVRAVGDVGDTMEPAESHEGTAP